MSSTEKDVSDPRGAIPSFRFTTSDLPPAQQFEAYRADAMPFVELFARDPGAGCAATSDAWSLGAVVVTRTCSPALDARRTAEMARRDGFDHWLVNLPTRSRQRLALSGSELEICSGRPIIQSCNEPFTAERRAAEEDWVVVFVTRDAVRGLALPAGHDSVTTLATPIGRLLVAFLRELGARVHGLTIAESAAVRDATIALLRATLAPTPDNLAAARPQAAAMLRERLRGMIRERLALATLTPERLCREAGISRTSLYRLFEPFGGVAAAIDAERLVQARRRLEDARDRRSIAQIAESVGHYDPSTFSRSFRRRYGVTPSEVRETARAGMPLTATVPRSPTRGVIDFLARAEW